MSLIKDVVIYNEDTMPLYNENLTISCHDKLIWTPPFFGPPSQYNNIIILKYLDPLALIILLLFLKYMDPHACYQL